MARGARVPGSPLNIVGSAVSKVNRNLRLGQTNARIVLGMCSKRSVFVGPRIIQISVPAPCDHRCVFCWGVSSDDRRWWVKPRHDFECSLRLIDEVAALGTLKFNFCSPGETLLFPRIKDLIEHIRRRSEAASIKVVTNGTSIPQIGLDYLVEQRVDCWLSLHAGDFETWNRIHRPATPDPEAMFANLKRSIRGLTESGRCRVVLHSVISKLNFRELQGIVEFARDTGVKHMNFAIARWSDEFELDASEHAELRGSMRRLKRSLEENGIAADLSAFDWYQDAGGFYARNRCYIGWLMTTIDIQGNIRPCCRGKPLGNIHEDSFGDVWVGPYADFRKASVAITEVGGVPDYDCSQCPHVNLNRAANRLVRFWRR